MTIVLCGGGTGGHITPLLAVARELRALQPQAKLVYIGEKNGKFNYIVIESGLFDDLRYVSAGKLRRYHGESLLSRVTDIKTGLLNIRDAFRFAAGTLQSIFLLRKLHADAIFLKGGFVSVPVAIGARVNQIPYVTHDSDALPGLANRIASRWAVCHAVALPVQYYPYPEASIRQVGVPIDNNNRIFSEEEKARIKQELGIETDAQVVFIAGGSLGARRLNEGVIKVLPRLLDSFPLLHVIHQIGKGNEDQYSSLTSTYTDRIIKFDFIPFEQLYRYVAASDVVVTRAGGTMLAEYAAQAKACIVVPNPYLTGGHQLKNAKVYQDANSAIIVSEEEIAHSDEVLLDAISSLLNDKEKRLELGTSLHKTVHNQNAALELAKLLIEVKKKT